MIALIPQFANTSAPPAPGATLARTGLEPASLPGGKAPDGGKSDFQRKLDEHTTAATTPDTPKAAAPTDAPATAERVREKVAGRAHDEPVDDKRVGTEVEQHGNVERETAEAESKPSRTRQGKLQHAALADAMKESATPQKFAGHSGTGAAGLEECDAPKRPHEGAVEISNDPAPMALTIPLAAPAKEPQTGNAIHGADGGRADHALIATAASSAPPVATEMDSLSNTAGQPAALPSSNSDELATGHEFILPAAPTDPREECGTLPIEKFPQQAAPEMHPHEVPPEFSRAAFGRAHQPEELTGADEQANATDAAALVPHQAAPVHRDLEALLERLPAPAVAHGEFNGLLGTQPRAEQADAHVPARPHQGVPAADTPEQKQAPKDGDGHINTAPVLEHGARIQYAAAEKRPVFTESPQTETPRSADAPARPAPAVQHTAGDSARSHSGGEGDARPDSHAGHEHEPVHISREMAHDETPGVRHEGVATTTSEASTAAPAAGLPFNQASSIGKSESPRISDAEAPVRAATLPEETLRAAQPARIAVSLDSAELGAISMWASARNEYVSATLAVESPELRGLIHSSLAALEQALAERQISVGAINLADANGFGNSSFGRPAGGSDAGEPGCQQDQREQSAAPFNWNEPARDLAVSRAAEPAARGLSYRADRRLSVRA